MTSMETQKRIGFQETFAVEKSERWTLIRVDYDDRTGKHHQWGLKHDDGTDFIFHCYNVPHPCVPSLRGVKILQDIACTLEHTGSVKWKTLDGPCTAILEISPSLTKFEFIVGGTPYTSLQICNPMIGKSFLYDYLQVYSKAQTHSIPIGDYYQKVVMASDDVLMSMSRDYENCFHEDGKSIVSAGEMAIAVHCTEKRRTSSGMDVWVRQLPPSPTFEVQTSTP